MNRLTQSKNTTILAVLIAMTLACFALSLQAQTCQDGCLTNNNTVLGDDAFISNTTGFGNTAMGFNALSSNTTGYYNTAIGSGDLDFNTTGSSNTATGAFALVANTTGTGNTATGAFALVANTTGTGNTATGAFALVANTTGYHNTATGSGALDLNTTGFDNTATGFQALTSNTTGSSNTAEGVSALISNTTGGGNTANGVDALEHNTTGTGNTANGAFALVANTTGHYNTANGDGALLSNATGGDNTAIGADALRNNNRGRSNIALGATAGDNLTTGSNNIDIGNQGVTGDAETIRIGTTGTQAKTFIAGISGATVPTGVAVIIDGSGHLGTTTSSARFKDEIKPMDKASKAILALRPVTFRYKKEIDPDGVPQFGLVAEDVEKVNPALVARDEQGKPYTVRYEAVNAMLLNEFLKEHRKVEELEAKLAKQEKDFTARLQEQDAKIQQVSAQLELSKPAPQTVLND